MNLGSLYAAATGAVSTAADFVLVSPENAYGVQVQYGEPDYINEDVFLFHIAAEQVVSANSDITDHFIENNTALQDHIALRPVVVNVSGFIGELNNVVPPALKSVKAVVDRLGTLSAYVPAITNTAERAYNTAEQLYRVAMKAKAAYQKIRGGATEKTEQEKAYAYFYQRYLDRRLFKVRTPYGIFSSMAIVSLRVTQSDADKNSSDFEISFKKIRTATTQLTQKSTSTRFQKPQVNNGSGATL